MKRLPYNFTVTMTGLILMKTRDDQRLAGHLMEAKGHRRLLSFRAVDVLDDSDLEAMPPRPIGIDSEGEEMVELEINANLSFDFGKPIGADEPASVEEPKGQVDLSGLASASDMGLAGLDESALNACRRVVVPAGATVHAGGYVLGRPSGKPLVWGFYSKNQPTVSGGKGKYLSNKVICSRRIPVGHFVVLKMGEVSLKLLPPGGGDVAISISNVPAEIDYSKKPGGAHVKHYASVYSTAPADVLIPKVEAGGANKPGGICPPGDGDG